MFIFTLDRYRWVAPVHVRATFFAQIHVRT